MLFFDSTCKYSYSITLDRNIFLRENFLKTFSFHDKLLLQVVQWKSEQHRIHHHLLTQYMLQPVLPKGLSPSFPSLRLLLPKDPTRPFQQHIRLHSRATPLLPVGKQKWLPALLQTEQTPVLPCPGHLWVKITVSVTLFWSFEFYSYLFFFSANLSSEGEGKRKEEEGKGEWERRKGKGNCKWSFKFGRNEKKIANAPAFLSLFFRHFVCAKKRNLRIYSINYSYLLWSDFCGRGRPLVKNVFC